MIKVVTVCGNGIGSSLLLRLKVEAIAKDLGIEVEAESFDYNFPETANVCIVESYTNRKKIEPVLAPVLQEMNNN